MHATCLSAGERHRSTVVNFCRIVPLTLRIVPGGTRLGSAMLSSVARAADVYVHMSAFGDAHER